MSLDESVVRERMQDLARWNEPPFTVVPETVLRSGRRLRRRRRLFAAGTALVSCVLLVMTGVLVRDTIASSPAATGEMEPVSQIESASPFEDEIDETIRSVLSEHEMTRISTIRQGNWDAAGAGPDDEQGTPVSVYAGYEIEPGKQTLGVRLEYGHVPSSQAARRLCADPVGTTQRCRLETRPGGSRIGYVEDTLTAKRFQRTVKHFRPGRYAHEMGYTVSVRLTLTDASYARARERWVYSEAELARLVTDDRLVLPEPRARRTAGSSGTLRTPQRPESAPHCTVSRAPTARSIDEFVQSSLGGQAIELLESCAAGTRGERLEQAEEQRAVSWFLRYRVGAAETADRQQLLSVVVDRRPGKAVTRRDKGEMRLESGEDLRAPKRSRQRLASVVDHAGRAGWYGVTARLEAPASTGSDDADWAYSQDQLRSLVADEDVQPLVRRLHRPDMPR